MLIYVYMWTSVYLKGQMNKIHVEFRNLHNSEVWCLDLFCAPIERAKFSSRRNHRKTSLDAVRTRERVGRERFCCTRACCLTIPPRARPRRRPCSLRTIASDSADRPSSAAATPSPRLHRRTNSYIIPNEAEGRSQNQTPPSPGCRPMAARLSPHRRVAVCRWSRPSPRFFLFSRVCFLSPLLLQTRSLATLSPSQSRC